MTRQKIYWLCQTIGWFCYGTLGFLIFLEYYEYSAKWLLFYSLATVFVLLVSHLLRAFIKKQNIVNHYNFKKFLLLVLAILISSIIVNIFSTLLILIIQIIPFNELSISRFMVYVPQTFSFLIIWVLIYLGIHFLEKNKEQRIKNLEMQLNMKELQLNALKAQISPHFMFNCLSDIRALIIENPQKARDMMTHISGFLRYTYRFTLEKVELHEELEFVKDYLELQKMHFEERLVYKINVDEKTSEVKIPPVIIQQLVENAIKHGIEKTINGGVINVHISLLDDLLLIKVENSGQLSEESSGGTGIKNIKKRLTLLFGEKFNFNIVNNDSENVLATLKIDL